MDKNQIISVMQKKGYQVTIEDRIPMFLLDSSVHTPQLLKKTLKENGYGNSFGYKLVAKGTFAKGAESLSNEPENKETEPAVEMDAYEKVKSHEESEPDTEINTDTSYHDESVKGTESDSKEAVQDKKAEENEYYDEDSAEDEDTDVGSSFWKDSDDFFESSDGQMSFF